MFSNFIYTYWLNAWKYTRKGWLFSRKKLENRQRSDSNSEREKKSTFMYRINIYWIDRQSRLMRTTSLFIGIGDRKLCLEWIRYNFFINVAKMFDFLFAPNEPHWRIILPFINCVFGLFFAFHSHFLFYFCLFAASVFLVIWNKRQTWILFRSFLQLIRWKVSLKNCIAVCEWGKTKKTLVGNKFSL